MGFSSQPSLITRGYPSRYCYDLVGAILSRKFRIFSLRLSMPGPKIRSLNLVGIFVDYIVTSTCQRVLNQLQVPSTLKCKSNGEAGGFKWNMQWRPLISYLSWRFVDNVDQYFDLMA